MQTTYTGPELSMSPMGSEARRHGTGPQRRPMNYKRRRAVAACARCRARKTKCDNQRPSCGFCISVSATCDYEENVDHSSYDPASLHILSRLDQLLGQQDEVLSAIQNLGGNHDLPQPSPANDSSYSIPVVSNQSGVNPLTSPGDSFLLSETAANHLKIPSARTIPDHILAWPILEGKYPPECLQEAVFESAGLPSGLDADGPSGGACRPFGTPSSTSSLIESEVLGLVERFLSMVHTKNPILDDDTLRRFANIVIEEGLSWNGPSCLVLLACALGAVTTPFSEAQAQITFDPFIYRQLQFESTSSDFDKADSYYLLACRRTGLLGTSIVASQCFFLSGVFLMYALRPVEAYKQFHQASLTFQMYLKCNQSVPKPPRAQKLEQRMYWSCFKSECEILSEISLPESGIADFEYPHMFPSPPEPSNPFAGSPGFNEGDADSTSISVIQQRSWFYYLAEIALRRIGNRVLNAFYRDDHHVWTNMDIHTMSRKGEEFIRLLDQWHKSLPEQLSYNQDDLQDIPREELSFMIRVRVLEIRSWIFRPFLYHAIHNRSHEPQQPLLPPFVAQALEHCICLIKTNSIRHRHHGVWYTCRVSAGAALSIVAAARCGNLPLPHDWQATVQLAIETLIFWEKTGPGDLRVARTILEELLGHVMGWSSM